MAGRRNGAIERAAPTRDGNPDSAARSRVARVVFRLTPSYHRSRISPWGSHASHRSRYGGSGAPLFTAPLGAKAPNPRKIKAREISTMRENIENLLLEHLKKIQAELAAARERDAEVMTRLGHIETGIARIARDESENYAKIIQDRHVVDRRKERIERIERRLEIS
jgi:hypothetical protein